MSFATRLWWNGTYGYPYNKVFEGLFWYVFVVQAGLWGVAVIVKIMGWDGMLLWVFFSAVHSLTIARGLIHCRLRLFTVMNPRRLRVVYRDDYMLNLFSIHLYGSVYSLFLGFCVSNFALVVMLGAVMIGMGWGLYLGGRTLQYGRNFQRKIAAMPTESKTYSERYDEVFLATWFGRNLSPDLRWLIRSYVLLEGNADLMTISVLLQSNWLFSDYQHRYGMIRAELVVDEESIWLRAEKVCLFRCKRAKNCKFQMHKDALEVDWLLLRLGRGFSLRVVIEPENRTSLVQLMDLMTRTMGGEQIPRGRYWEPAFLRRI
jgi:hypothetical protein